jgi:CRP-like cAMP-binding protein
MIPAELLVRSPLFARLSPAELQKIGALFRRRRYRASEPVFREGDPGTALYIVDTGEVKILLGGPDGKEVTLSLLGPSEFFGELALLDGEPRSADAIATVPTELLVLPRDDFTRFLFEVPAVAVNMLAALSRRFRRTDRLVHDAAFSDVRTRVTRVLVELADTRGKPVDGGVAIGPRLTQADLATMVGVTRESINKCLRALATQGLLRHERGRLVILHIDKLRAQLA